MAVGEDGDAALPSGCLSSRQRPPSDLIQRYLPFPSLHASIPHSIHAILFGWPPALVVDPVLVSTSGSRLAQSSILPTLRAELYPLVDLLTPNLAEAAAILEEAGEEAVDMRDVEGMKNAARIIQALGPK